MAQPPGRDPSRPFAALAAAQGLGVSDPGPPHSAVSTKRRCASFVNRTAKLPTPLKAVCLKLADYRIKGRDRLKTMTLGPFRDRLAHCALGGRNTRGCNEFVQGCDKPATSRRNRASTIERLLRHGAPSFRLIARARDGSN